MRNWRRATGSGTCGLCGHVVPKDAPVLVVEAPPRRPLLRCEDCASVTFPGECVPEALLPPVTPAESPPVVLPPWRAKPYLAPPHDRGDRGDRGDRDDWKARAAEPGKTV